jgi:hypothetical protein
VKPNGHAFRFHELQLPARIKERTHRLIPGGCHTYPKGDDQYPVLAPGFIARGLGCRVWDTEGEYIEHGMGNQAVGLGHAYPPVLQAVQQELSRGANFTRPSPIEVACAEQFLALIDGGEMVKFLQGWLGRDVGGRRAGTRLHREGYDRLLRRPSLLLDGRLVYRHNSDECWRTGSYPAAHGNVPI